MNPRFLEKPYYNLYFVRHGLSIGNLYHIFGGWMDLPLSEEGKADLAAYKMSIPYPEADLYLHSGLTRAKETMQIITGKPTENCSDWHFSESYFGVREGSVPEDMFENEAFYEKFYQDIPQGYGEEIFSEQIRRVYKGILHTLSLLRAEGLNSAYIFGHYGTIKSALYSFLPHTHEGKERQLIPNGSLWHFLFKEDDEEMHCQVIRAYFADNYTDLIYSKDEITDMDTLLRLP